LGFRVQRCIAKDTLETNFMHAEPFSSVLDIPVSKLTMVFQRCEVQLLLDNAVINWSNVNFHGIYHHEFPCVHIGQLIAIPLDSESCMVD
jgi:hypothetical protein